MLLSCYSAPDNLLVLVFNHHFHRYFIKYAITVLIDILYADVISFICQLHVVLIFWPSVLFMHLCSYLFCTVFTVGAVNFKLTTFSLKNIVFFPPYHKPSWKVGKKIIMLLNDLCGVVKISIGSDYIQKKTTYIFHHVCSTRVEIIFMKK